VQRGDMVRIVLESPVIKVSTPGEALEAGKPGDTIRVKNTSSQREVRAQVVDKQTVRIPL
jgi:flagella basal body P-ring formation protein FlgA